MSVNANRGKLILICLENKRSLDFTNQTAIFSHFAAAGYYFDKVSRIAYNQPTEISRELSSAANNFQNVVISCPDGMAKAVYDFFENKLGGKFDNLGMLASDDTHVFVLCADIENRLTYSDIKNILDKKYSLRYDKTVIKLYGASKEQLNAAIAAASKSFGQGEVFFNLTEDYGDIKIEIVYSSLAPKIALDDAVRSIVSALHDYVYAMEDISLAEQLFRLLQLRRLNISVAESFTGGGICKKLVQVSGVSQVFHEGLNTYSNLAKMQRLGVSELTLKQCGAVSAETAYQMAEGLLKTGYCEVAISTTGIAGPKSDNTQKPVGLAFIGVGVGDDIAVYKYNFVGDRERITQTAINQALFLAYKRLK